MTDALPLPTKHVVGLPGRLVEVLSQPVFRGFALGLSATVIWGGYLAMARAGIAAGLAASDIAFIRYGVAGLVMTPGYCAIGPRPWRASAGAAGWCWRFWSVRSSS